MRSRSLPLLSTALLAAIGAALVVAACASPDPDTTQDDDLRKRKDAGAETGAPDAGRDVDASAFTPVAHPPLPQIPNHGGPIVAHPEVVTITWSADPIAADLEAFDAWIVASPFWKDMMGEWGVGAGKRIATYRVPTKAPATLDDADIQALLADLFAKGLVPPPSADRIYAVYPPAGTVVTNFGAAGCTAFQAYHYSFGAPGQPLAIYGVTPRCDGSGFTPLDATTWAMSHELMEAASDPDYLHPAWVISSQTPATPETGENADLCVGHPTRVDGHLVTRNWSNVAAKKGERPCVPAPSGPGFGLFVPQGRIAVAPGGSASARVQLWSAAEMPAFRVGLFAADPSLDVQLDVTAGKNGDEGTLTVKAKPGFAPQPGANLIFLYATAGDYSTRTAVIVDAKR